MIKVREPLFNYQATLRAVTKEVTRRPVVTSSVTHCPTCGHKLKAHPTAAAKQKAYRERRKAQHV